MRETREGVRGFRDKLLRSGARNPLGVFLSGLRDGAHRAGEFQPTEPPPEPPPCEHCGFTFGGHAPDCPRAPRSVPSLERGECPECELPGGNHLLGCPLAPTIAGSGNGDGRLPAREQEILDLLVETFDARERQSA